MRTSVLALTVMVGAGLLADPASRQEHLVVGDSPFTVVDGWLKPFAEAGFAFGSHAGVFAGRTQKFDRIDGASFTEMLPRPDAPLQ